MRPARQRRGQGPVRPGFSHPVKRDGRLLSENGDVERWRELVKRIQARKCCPARAVVKHRHVADVQEQRVRKFPGSRVVNVCAEMFEPLVVCASKLLPSALQLWYQ